MSDNQVAEAVLVLALAAHAAALLWLLRPRNRLGPLLSVNAAVSACILAYQAQRIRYVLALPADYPLLALVAFEALVLAAAAWAVRGRRLPVVVSCLAFALHLCAGIAALVFLLTFRITRLI